MVNPPYRIKNMVPGMIMLWAGAIVDIPSGWHLCDGTMGTPDLRGRVIRAAGDPYIPGATGGASEHTHDFTGDSHRHSIPAGTYIAAGADFASYTTFAAATGETDLGYSWPPFHQLCYIMKL